MRRGHRLVKQGATKPAIFFTRSTGPCLRGEPGTKACPTMVRLGLRPAIVACGAIRGDQSEHRLDTHSFQMVSSTSPTFVILQEAGRETQMVTTTAP